MHRDQTVAPVTPSDGTVVSHLLGHSGAGEVVDSAVVVVSGVDVELEVDLLAADDLEGVVVDLVVQLLDGGLVVVCVVDALVDHGAGDGHGDVVSDPGGHDLDVLSGLGQVLLHDAVDVLLGLEDEPVCDGEGGVSDSEGSVVGEVSGCLVDTGQVVGSHSELGVEDDLGVDVQVGEGLPQVLPGGLQRDGLAGEGLEVLALSDVCGGASDEQDVGGVDDVSASEGRGRLTGCDLRLVGVVVEDVAELLLVHLAEGLADLLREGIGDTVGVSDSFPLDDLYLFHGDGDLVETLYVDVLTHLAYTSLGPHYFVINKQRCR